MRFVKIIFLSSFSLIAFSALLATFSLSKINGLLIIHLDQYRSVVLGTQLEVVLISLLGGILVAINFGLARSFKNRENFFTVLLSVSSLVLSLLILIFVFAIISIN